MNLNLPTVQDALHKAALVRSKKLESRDIEINAGLDLLSDAVRHAVEETVPHNGAYTIVVQKKRLKHFSDVIRIFTTDMTEKGWTIICEEKKHTFKKYLHVTFAPSPHQEPSDLSNDKEVELSSKTSKTTGSSKSRQRKHKKEHPNSSTLSVPSSASQSLVLKEFQYN